MCDPNLYACAVLLRSSPTALLPQRPTEASSLKAFADIAPPIDGDRRELNLSSSPAQTAKLAPSF